MRIKCTVTEIQFSALSPKCPESTAAVVVPSPRSCGERAAQIFQQGLMGEGLLRSKSTRQEPLTRHSLPKVRAALSPQERGEGTNTGSAFFDAGGKRRDLSAEARLWATRLRTRLRRVGTSVRRSFSEGGRRMRRARVVRRARSSASRSSFACPTPAHRDAAGS